MADIHISREELDNPQVDEIIAMEASIQRRESAEFVEDVQRPFLYNPMFYYSIAGGSMAFLGWALIEPAFSDFDTGDDSGGTLAAFGLFMVTAALVGLGLGCVYGIANRNSRQAFIYGSVGLAIGLLAAIPLMFLAGVAFLIGTGIAASFTDATFVESWGDFSPITIFLLICSRSLAWALVGPAAGLSLGVALKSKKLLSVGIIGGIIGGAVGGLTFDPVDMLFNDENAEAWLSRMTGLTSVGFFIGLFTGYIENLSRTAWLQMLQGPLTGKQFNLFKTEMTLGSDPRADIYLFKDPSISPEHAKITVTGSKFLLTDSDSSSGLFVNGSRTQQKVLEKGDVVTLGETVLRYEEQTQKR